MPSYAIVLLATAVTTIVVVSFIVNKLFSSKGKPSKQDASNNAPSEAQEQTKPPVTEEVDYSDQIVPERVVTLEELKKYNGANDVVWIGVNGLVYDVTAKREMYGGSGSYGLFAGTDATRGLAKSSLEPADLVPLGSLENLTEKQLKTLSEWEAFYRKRYKIVGKLQH